MVRLATTLSSPLVGPDRERVTFSVRHTYHAGEQASNRGVVAIVRGGSWKVVDLRGAALGMRIEAA